MTCLQVDFVPLITTLRAWPFSRFLVYLTVPLPKVHTVSFYMRTLLDKALKDLIKLR